MRGQIEAPPITRREIDVAHRWAKRDIARRQGEPVPELDRDILLCLDLIALLRADLAVAVVRVTSWARLAREQQEALAAVAVDGGTRATVR